MAQYCDNFLFQDTADDSFQFWNGLRGPAGPAGVPGPPGSSVELKGPVASTAQLPASAPSDELWMVGESSPYTGYFWNSARWVDLGPILQGPQGDPGEPGTDGVSPEVTIAAITGGHAVTITDADHPVGQTFDVMDGEDGQDGADGTTFTPSVSAQGVISWTNDGGKTNPPSVDIKGPQGPAGADGSDGQDGANGTTFTPSVSAAGVISWTNDGGKQNPPSVDIKGPQGPAGADGSDGQDGANGTTFTPSVSAQGVISWTNDGGKQNPQPVDIKGPQGATGPAGPGVPTGGTVGQVLTKTGSADYAAGWADPFRVHVASLTIPFSSWSGSGPWSQVITISGATITANTKVDLQAGPTALAQLIADGVSALTIENNNGTLTLYALGAVTTADVTVQVSWLETS